MNIEQIAFEVADELFLGGKAVGREPVEFLRRCLSKLAEQDVEPVAWEWVNPEKGMCISHQEPPEYEEAYQISKLFTETQLLAAQQRTAEACAGLMESQHTWVTREAASALIRNGNWSEYL